MRIVKGLLIGLGVGLACLGFLLLISLMIGLYDIFLAQDWGIGFLQFWFGTLRELIQSR